MFLSRRRPPCFFNDNFVKRQLELVNSVVTRLEFQSVLDVHLSLVGCGILIWSVDSKLVFHIYCVVIYFRNLKTSVLNVISVWKTFDIHFDAEYIIWIAQHIPYLNLWMKYFEAPDYFPFFWRKPSRGGDIWNDNNLWFILCLP